MTPDLDSVAPRDDEPDTTTPPPDEPGVSATASEEVRPDHLVPVWMAAVVIVLFAVVAGLGGYVLRGMIVEAKYTSPEQREIQMRLSEVAADRENPRTRLALAYAYQQAERFEEALTEYDSVLKLIPNDTAAHFNKGMIYFEMDEEARAEEALREVLEINPGHVLAAKVLGEHFLEKRDYRSMLAAVRPAAQTNESSADLQYLTGLAHEKLGDAHLAEEYYRIALRYYPDMAEAREALERLSVEP